MTIHVFLFFPETAGKNLEQIEDMFLEGTSAWKTHVAEEPSPSRLIRNDAEYGSAEKPRATHHDARLNKATGG